MLYKGKCFAQSGEPCKTWNCMRSIVRRCGVSVTSESGPSHRPVGAAGGSVGHGRVEALGGALGEAGGVRGAGAGGGGKSGRHRK